MIITFDRGHMVGQDRGAIGIISEETIINQYVPVMVNELIRQGHTLIDCTPTDVNATLNDSLAYRVNKANASGSQLHICCHANAFNGSAHGSEVEVASDSGEKYGRSILNEIVKLGFTDRGVNRPNLYVTKNTDMPCVLIEPLFCDSSVDIALFNYNALGLAIATGIINIIGGHTNPIAKEVVPVDDNNSMPINPNNTPLNGGGWIERVADSRTILHQSRSVYLALTADGHLDFTANSVTKRIV